MTFYYKKRNVPEHNDFIAYPSMEALIKYEGITKNTYMYERKVWLIQTVYLTTEKKGQFYNYKKCYIRFQDYQKVKWMSDRLEKRARKNLNN